MNIEVKFNIGDKVYYLDDNRINSSIITHIYTETSKHGVLVKYDLLSFVNGSGDKLRDSISEGKIFLSKQELIDSL